MTGCIGTNAADDAVANTSPGEADEAWAGGASKLYEHGGDIATIEMGARQYLPGLGRFLEMDPVAGGNANAYNYPNDPINFNDWTGDILNLGIVIASDFNPWLTVARLYLDRCIVAAVLAQVHRNWIVYMRHKVGYAESHLKEPGYIKEQEDFLADVALSVRACALVCGEGGSSVHQGTLGVGLGPKLGVAGAVGYDYNRKPGWNFGLSCDVAAGPVGVSGDGGLNVGKSSSGYSGGGWAFGAELGCSLDLTYTVDYY